MQDGWTLGGIFRNLIQFELCAILAALNDVSRKIYVWLYMIKNGNYYLVTNARQVCET